MIGEYSKLSLGKVWQSIPIARNFLGLGWFWSKCLRPGCNHNNYCRYENFQRSALFSEDQNSSDTYKIQLHYDLLLTLYIILIISKRIRTIVKSYARSINSNDRQDMRPKDLHPPQTLARTHIRRCASYESRVHSLPVAIKRNSSCISSVCYCSYASKKWMFVEYRDTVVDIMYDMARGNLSSIGRPFFFRYYRFVP